MKGKLIKKEYLKDFIPVYDIEVSQNNNFFANNILVHNCKDPSSHQGANLLKTQSEYKLGMTGTPLMNNPLDVYVPLK
mgnify:FL=1